MSFSVFCCYCHLHCGHTSNFPLSLKPLKVIAFFLTTKYDPIWYFQVLYSVTRFILLVAFLKGKDINQTCQTQFKPSLVEREDWRTEEWYNCLKEDGRTGRVETGHSAPRTRPTHGAHSCSLTTHKHGRLASSHASSTRQAFLSRTGTRWFISPRPSTLQLQALFLTDSFQR